MQGKLLLPRSAPAASPRASLFCTTRHPWRPTQLQPRRNRSSNVVHLALRGLAALSSSLFHLPRHPRIPPPTRTHDRGRGGGSLRTCEHPSPGLPLDIGPTPQFHVTNARITGVIRTDSSRPSRGVRAPAFASSASTTPSRGSRCGEQTASVPNRRSSASKDTQVTRFRVKP